MSLSQFPPLGLTGLLTTGRVPFAQSALGLKDDSTFTFNSTTKVLTVSGLSISSGSGITFSDATVQTTAASTTSIGAVPTSRTISTSGGLQGGGDLSANRTLSIATGGVTNAMLQNASLTVSAGTGLAGGGSVALGASVSLNVDQSFSPTWSGSHTFSNNVVLNGTPTLSTHAVNKGYVDTAIQGLSPKASALVLANANITLSGTQTIDGVGVVAGNRVLAIGQTTTTQNGLWVVAAGAWTRPVDFATGAHAAGTYLFVEEGTTFADTAWVCTTNPPNDVVDSNALAFVQFSGAGTYSAGAGLTLTGTTFSIGSAQVTNAMLVNSSVTVTAGTGLSGGGAVALGASVTLSLPNTGTSGLKTFATGDSITTDAQGRVTASTVVTRQVLTSTGLLGGGNLTADRTLSVDQSFSPTWTGTHTWSTGTATFAASAAKISSGSFVTSLASAATAARVWTFPDATDTAAGIAATQTLTNKTISGSSNTLTNIANGSLTNSSVTVTAGTGLSGGGAVALGASVTISMPNTGPGAGTIGGGTSFVNSVTLDAQGRVTGATTGVPGIAGARTVEQLLTTTAATTVATYTPASTKGLWVAYYFRVVTATTNVTVTVTYTDVTGAMTLAAEPITAQVVGSYVRVPIFIVSTAAAVTVTITAGTANQVFASAAITEA
jgi:hypothetical protein